MVILLSSNKGKLIFICPDVPSLWYVQQSDRLIVFMCVWDTGMEGRRGGGVDNWFLIGKKMDEKYIASQIISHSGHNLNRIQHKPLKQTN